MRVLTIGIFMLAACTACAQSNPPTPPLVLATWNVEHLAAANGDGCRPRVDTDYAAIRDYAAASHADVVAFQEVENEEAAARIFDPSLYQIVTEQRVGSGRRTECNDLPNHFMTRQATGFAIRSGLRFERHPDYTSLQAGGADLRSGVDITVFPEGAAPIRLLSIHLKSGCHEGSRRRDCPRLFEQVPALESWIDQRADAGERFAVLGDFNRWLAVSDDIVWQELDDADPPDADLTLASGYISARCNDRYPHFIDNIVVDRQTSPFLRHFVERTFSGQALSDHCMVTVEIGDG